MLRGMPVYILPFLAKGTVRRCLKDTPEECVLVDSRATLEHILAHLQAKRAGKTQTCGQNCNLSRGQ